MLCIERVFSGERDKCHRHSTGVCLARSPLFSRSSRSLGWLCFVTLNQIILQNVDVVNSTRRSRAALASVGPCVHETSGR